MHGPSCGSNSSASITANRSYGRWTCAMFLCFVQENLQAFSMVSELWWLVQSLGQPFLDLVYLDFAKAFDSANHQMLCDKMFAYGIHQTIVNWTRSIFFKLAFKFCVTESESALVPSCSVVPRCWIMGSIRFLVFVNDLPDVLSGNDLLFADDVKLMSARSQYKELYPSLQVAFQWSGACDLPLNAAKCSNVMCIKIVLQKNREAFYWKLWPFCTGYTKTD